MKMKTIGALFVSVLTILSLAGCGNEKGKDETKGKTVWDERDYEIETPNEDIVKEDGNEDSDEDSKEEKKEDIVFDAVEEWACVTYSDRAIQIDDVLYTPGVSVADFIAKVESSSIEYEYEYHADKLMNNRDKEVISFFKNGEEWFSVSAFNIFEDTTVLSDVVVVTIDIADAANPYVRYLDGRTFDEILEMRYSDVIQLDESAFGDYFTSPEEETITHDDVECICIQYRSNDGYLPNVVEWSDYEVNLNYWLAFYVSKDTSEVIDFEVTYAYAYSSGLSDGGYLTSLSDLSDDMILTMIDYAEEAISGDAGTDATCKSVYGMALTAYGWGTDWHNVWMILEMDINGETKYRAIYFKWVKLTKNGINPKTLVVYGEDFNFYDSPEEVIANGTFDGKAIEKTY